MTQFIILHRRNKTVNLKWVVNSTSKRVGDVLGDTCKLGSCPIFPTCDLNRHQVSVIDRAALTGGKKTFIKSSDDQQQMVTPDCTWHLMALLFKHWSPTYAGTKFCWGPDCFIGTVIANVTWATGREAMYYLFFPSQVGPSDTSEEFCTGTFWAAGKQICSHNLMGKYYPTSLYFWLYHLLNENFSC